jgi:hypothetical protein
VLPKPLEQIEIMRPTLAVIYQTGMPTASFEEFARTVSDGSVEVHLEATEPRGPLAGIMWTMMTVITLAGC